jgi:hypothetical protein
LIVLAVLAVLAVLTGCATIIRGTTQAYNVTSIPSGAAVSFSTGETCTTPCAVKKKRNEPFAVNVVKDGYEPYVFQVTTETCREAATTTIANLVMIGSVLWCSIDAILGSTQNLYPNPGIARMVPLEGPSDG